MNSPGKSDFGPLLEDLRRFVADRDWGQFHDPKNLAMLVGSEAGELLAEYRWVKSTDADVHSRQPEARARIAAEIGDVALALLMLCDRIGVDLVEVAQKKLAANGLKYPAALSRGRSDKPRG